MRTMASAVETARCAHRLVRHEAILKERSVITSKIKHAIKLKTSHYAVISCKQKQNANEGCSCCAAVVQVLQDLFYVLLHVIFYLLYCGELRVCNCCSHCDD